MPPRGWQLAELAKERILVLDGAMGTMLQREEGLDEAAFRGARWADHAQPLQGNNDALSVSQPAIVERIHRWYLEVSFDAVLRRLPLSAWPKTAPLTQKPRHSSRWRDA